MGLTKRARNGVRESGSVQKWSQAKIGAVAIGGILVILLVLFSISAVRKSVATKRAAETAKQEREYRKWRDEQTAEYLRRRNEPYQPPAPNSADYGSAMGHMVAMLGKSYPTDAEIEQMAKTKAVDAGHRPDNPIFIRSFKTAFAAGYSEGRRKYNAR